MESGLGAAPALPFSPDAGAFVGGAGFGGAALAAVGVGAGAAPGARLGQPVAAVGLAQAEVFDRAVDAAVGVAVFCGDDAPGIARAVGVVALVDHAQHAPVVVAHAGQFRPAAQREAPFGQAVAQVGDGQLGRGPAVGGLGGGVEAGDEGGGGFGQVTGGEVLPGEAVGLEVLGVEGVGGGGDTPNFDSISRLPYAELCRSGALWCRHGDDGLVKLY